MAYDKSFYEEQCLGSLNSARQIVPFLLEQFNLESVVDLGCGLGTWLSCFIANGVSDVVGYDGDYVPQDYLQIPAEYFHAADLTGEIDFTGRYSLAMSLEVAEHIAPEKAGDFVRKLTSLSELVLFSSAFPYQGGTGHVNENYPEYWALLFWKEGYIPLDILRDRFWFDGKICPWYRQNILLFVNEKVYQAKYSHLPHAVGKPLTKIHPEMYLWSCVRSRDHHLPPELFEEDKPAFYALLDSWCCRQENPPDSVRYYGDEYNIEYSRMVWWQKLKLKSKYYWRKWKEQR